MLMSGSGVGRAASADGEAFWLRVYRFASFFSHASTVDLEPYNSMPFLMDADEGANASIYGHKHRAFLQALLSRQVITYEQAKPIIAAIQTAATPERPSLENDVTHEDFETYLQAIGDAISPFDFEIRSSIHQVTKERVHALVNTTSDALTQIATVHSADEIAFVKRVLDHMFGDEMNNERKEIMAVKRNEACRLHKPPRDREAERRDSEAQTQNQAPKDAGITYSHAERLLDSLVNEGWLEFNDTTQYYSLSPRSLMELRTWLVDAYNLSPEEQAEEDDDDEDPPHQKIKFCAACQDIVTVGQRCSNLPCNTRLHDHCMRNYFRARQGGRSECAVCKTAWGEDGPFVGERAAVGQQQQRGGGRRRGGAAAAAAVASSSRRRNSAAPATNGHRVDSEEEEEDDVDEGVE